MFLMLRTSGKSAKHSRKSLPRANGHPCEQCGISHIGTVETDDRGRFRPGICINVNGHIPRHPALDLPHEGEREGVILKTWLSIAGSAALADALRPTR